MPLRHLKKIQVQFNPKDHRATAVREFLNRIYSPRARKSNPECDVSHKIRTDDMPPVVAIEFENGAKEQFNCHALKVEDIAGKIKDISDSMETKANLKASGIAVEELKFEAVDGKKKKSKSGSYKFVV
jgi:large subunit ribosomal protein L53|tara:strand:+ start:631 stop:1014 length:384 start_codon:yes stop_codon:yes gene_type:complete